MHFAHCNSASSRGNLKLSQRIALLLVVIVEVFNLEGAKNFCKRPILWWNAQNGESSLRWRPSCSRRLWICWSQALRNATGHLSICFCCGILVSQTSQNRASHSRLNLKIFAVLYLGYNSSKFPPKPLVEKVVSRTVYCRHFLGNTFSQQLLLDHKHIWISPLKVFPKPTSPGNSQKFIGVVHCVTDCTWMSRNSTSVISDFLVISSHVR